MATVKLTYFAFSGKYKYEGEFEYPDAAPVYDIPDQVRVMHNDQRLPGLASGTWSGHVHVDPNDHPHAYPFLVKLGVED